MGKTGNVTRADVARRANVSETIVSYVVNNNRYVDKDKQERVLQAIKELNYQPNIIARALKGKRSNNILFIVDNPANERLSVLMGYMDRYAYEKGTLISLCATRNDPAFVQLILSRQFDGIVISSMSMLDEYIQQFVDAGVPTVLFLTREYRHVTGAATIGTGLYHGAKNAVRYFYQQGRRNIIYIDRASQRKHFATLDEDNRLRGFTTQMEELGLSWEGKIITGCKTEEEVQEKLERMLREHPVDAILGRNDRMACTAMQQILKLGLRVPEDVAVIGFDDSSISRYVTPQITSFQMPDEELAKAAIDMLDNMIQGKKQPPNTRYEARMIVRGSTEKDALSYQTKEND